MYKNQSCSKVRDLSENSMFCKRANERPSLSPIEPRFVYSNRDRILNIEYFISASNRESWENTSICRDGASFVVLPVIFVPVAKNLTHLMCHGFCCSLRNSYNLLLPLFLPLRIFTIFVIIWNHILEVLNFYIGVQIIRSPPHNKKWYSRWFYSTYESGVTDSCIK